MEKIKVFITGESGNIATSLISELKTKNEYEIINFLPNVEEQKEDVRVNYKGTYFNASNEINILKKDVLKKIFEDHKPDIVIHTAAMVNTDKCEQNEKDATQVNEIGSKNVAELAKNAGSYLINFSTTATFDTEDYEYPDNLMTETTKRKPHTHYGKTKMKGEEIIKEVYASCSDKLLNILPVFIFGYYPNDNASAIVKMIYAAKNKQKTIVKLSKDNFKNYFWCEDAAKAIIQLIEKKTSGDIILSNYAQEARKFGDILNILCKTLKMRKYDFMKYVKLRPKEDYLHQHIAGNMKLVSEIGEYEITNFNEAIKKVVESVETL